MTRGEAKELLPVIQAFAEGLLRLAFCSLCFAILPPLFSMDDDNKKKMN